MMTERKTFAEMTRAELIALKETTEVEGRQLKIDLLSAPPSQEDERRRIKQRQVFNANQIAVANRYLRAFSEAERASRDTRSASFLQAFYEAAKSELPKDTYDWLRRVAREETE